MPSVLANTANLRFLFLLYSSRAPGELVAGGQFQKPSCGSVHGHGCVLPVTQQNTRYSLVCVTETEFTI
jgi:hypothetical protein